MLKRKKSCTEFRACVHVQYIHCKPTTSIYIPTQVLNRYKATYMICCTGYVSRCSYVVDIAIAAVRSTKYLTAMAWYGIGATKKFD